MKIARLTALVAAALAVVVVVPFALAAAVPGRAKYLGQTGSGGAVTLRVSGDGKTVKRMRIHYQVTCNDHQPRQPTYTDIVDAQLRRDGSFKGAGEYQGSVVKDTNRFKVAGKLTTRGASGTFSLTATSTDGSNVQCKTGKLTWSATRQK
jgi:hypothetical protein